MFTPVGLARLRADRPGRIPATVAPPPNSAHNANPAIPAIEFADVRVAATESHDEMEVAHHLVRQRYGSRGYEFDAPGGDLCATYSNPRLRHEITFIATNPDATIGTITLGLDGPLGLRADGTHHDIVQRVRVGDRRVCELTRLAIADGVGSRRVLAALFNLAYIAADTMHGVTDVFIEVNPRHVTFYSRVLGFAVAAKETFCERVRAPSVLLHVEMKTLGGRLEALAERALLTPMRARAA